MTGPVPRIAVSHAAVALEAQLERAREQQILAREKPVTTKAPAPAPTAVPKATPTPAKTTQTSTKPPAPTAQAPVSRRSAPAKGRQPTASPKAGNPGAEPVAASSTAPSGSLILSPAEVAELDKLLATHPALHPNRRTRF